MKLYGFLLKKEVTILGANNAIGKITATLSQELPVSTLKLYDSNKNTHNGLPKITKCQLRNIIGNKNIGEAIEGSDVIIIGDDVTKDTNHHTLFKKKAPQIIEYVSAIAKYNPSAMIVVAASPVNYTLPFVNKILEEKGKLDPRRVVGMTTMDLTNASLSLASHLQLSPAKVMVPVVGGSSRETRVPLFSRAKPRVRLSANVLQKLTSEVKQSDISTNMNIPQNEALIRAQAASKFLQSILFALEKDEVVETALTQHDFIEGTNFFSLPLILGKKGVQKRILLPKLTEYEAQLVTHSVNSLRKEYELALQYLREIEKNKKEKESTPQNPILNDIEKKSQTQLSPEQQRIKKTSQYFMMNRDVLLVNKDDSKPLKKSKFIPQNTVTKTQAHGVETEVSSLSSNLKTPANNKDIRSPPNLNIAETNSKEVIPSSKTKQLAVEISQSEDSTESVKMIEEYSTLKNTDQSEGKELQIHNAFKPISSSTSKNSQQNEKIVNNQELEINKPKTTNELRETLLKKVPTLNNLYKAESSFQGNNMNKFLTVPNRVGEENICHKRNTSKSAFKEEKGVHLKADKPKEKSTKVPTRKEKIFGKALPQQTQVNTSWNTKDVFVNQTRKVTAKSMTQQKKEFSEGVVGETNPDLIIVLEELNFLTLNEIHEIGHEESEVNSLCEIKKTCHKDSEKINDSNTISVKLTKIINSDNENETATTKLMLLQEEQSNSEIATKTSRNSKPSSSGSHNVQTEISLSSAIPEAEVIHYYSKNCYKGSSFYELKPKVTNIPLLLTNRGFSSKPYDEAEGEVEKKNVNNNASAQEINKLFKKAINTIENGNQEGPTATLLKQNKIWKQNKQPPVPDEEELIKTLLEKQKKLLTTKSNYSFDNPDFEVKSEPIKWKVQNTNNTEVSSTKSSTKKITKPEHDSDLRVNDSNVQKDSEVILLSQNDQDTRSDSCSLNQTSEEQQKNNHNETSESVINECKNSLKTEAAQEKDETAQIPSKS